MGAFLLDATSTVLCPHGMQVKHPPSQQKVLIKGAPALVLTDMGAVAGCPFQLPPPKPSPCVTVQWTKGALKVLVGGQPALLQTSMGLCKSPEQAPQGPPNPTVVQPKVMGT
jgi:hypothetical protein